VVHDITRGWLGRLGRIQRMVIVSFHRRDWLRPRSIAPLFVTPIVPAPEEAVRGRLPARCSVPRRGSPARRELSGHGAYRGSETQPHFLAGPADAPPGR